MCFVGLDAVYLGAHVEGFYLVGRWLFLVLLFDWVLGIGVEIKVNRGARGCEFCCRLLQTLRARGFLQLDFRLSPWLLLYSFWALFDEINILQLFQEASQVCIIKAFDNFANFIFGLI